MRQNLRVPVVLFLSVAVQYGVIWVEYFYGFVTRWEIVPVPLLRVALFLASLAALFIVLFRRGGLVGVYMLLGLLALEGAAGGFAVVFRTRVFF